MYYPVLGEGCVHLTLLFSSLGCGYPPLSVRAVTKKLADLFQVPVLGFFDYNVSECHSSTCVLVYL